MQLSMCNQTNKFTKQRTDERRKDQLERVHSACCKQSCPGITIPLVIRSERIVPGKVGLENMLTIQEAMS